MKKKRKKREKKEEKKREKSQAANRPDFTDLTSFHAYSFRSPRPQASFVYAQGRLLLRYLTAPVHEGLPYGVGCRSLSVSFFLFFLVNPYRPEQLRKMLELVI